MKFLREHSLTIVLFTVAVLAFLLGTLSSHMKWDDLQDKANNVGGEFTGMGAIAIFAKHLYEKDSDAP